jgi:CHAT domain
MNNYLNITVHISPGADDNFNVRAESDDSGETGNSTFELPFQLKDLSGTVFGVSAMSRGFTLEDPGEAATRPGEAEDDRNAADFGVALFDALFQRETRDVLAAIESRARSLPDTGVRIRLSMDLLAPGMTEVANLPWELICRKNQHPLVVSTQTPLVRALDVPQPAEPGPFIAPLRILVLMSNPQGTDGLNLDKERALIEKSWARLPGVEVDFVRPVKDELLRQLAEADYHVVHYMGHGDFQADAGGTLILETADGSPHPVSGDEFTVWLRDEPLRLVFLNACKSGTTGVRSGSHPFSGVATALIRDRVPAVVAMQFPISDTAAIAFSQAFYERIAQGFPVDAAVVEGRKVLYSPSQTEWVTPVLYLRSKDSMLFSDHTAEALTPSPGNTTDKDNNTERSTPAQVTGDEWGAGSPDDLRIFLATPDQDREKLHAQISRTLSSLEGVRIIDSVTLDEDSHAQTVDRLVRSADLCVHLLGANAGRRLDVDDGQPLRTFPLEELEAGRKAARAQLVVITREDKQSIANPEYAAHIDELAKLPRNKARFELVITDKNQILSAALEKLGELKKARETAQASEASDQPIGRTAFVDSHINDQIYAIELLAYLEDRNIRTQINTTSSATPTNLSQLDETVKNSSLYVIVAGNVDSRWVSNRRVAIMRSAVKCRAPLLVASYSAPQIDGQEIIQISGDQLDISTLNDSDRSWLDRLFEAEAGAGA